MTHIGDHQCIYLDHCRILLLVELFKQALQQEETEATDIPAQWTTLNEGDLVAGSQPRIDPPQQRTSHCLSTRYLLMRPKVIWFPREQ